MRYSPQPPHPDHLFSGLTKLIERLSVPEDDASVFVNNVNTFSTRISDPHSAEHYRGYSLDELVRKSCFLQTAHLLIHGSRPNDEELADFQSILMEKIALPAPVLTLIRETPMHVEMTELLRSICGLLPLFDSQATSNSTQDILWQTYQLLMQIPAIIVERHRMLQGWEPAEYDRDLHWTSNLSQLLTNRTPTPLSERTLEVLMITQAELGHDSATHAVRLVASRGGHLYSAISSAFNTLPNDANVLKQREVLKQLEESDSQRLEQWARNINIADAQLLGFGPYNEREHLRLQYYNTFGHFLADENDLTDYEKNARMVERIITECTGLFPSSNWGAIRLLHYLGMEPDLSVPFQLTARIAGWAAHLLEQKKQGPLVPSRLEYEGPIRPFEEE